jgi:hypothetical protein
MKSKSLKTNKRDLIRIAGLNMDQMGKKSHFFPISSVFNPKLGLNLNIILLVSYIRYLAFNPRSRGSQGDLCHFYEKEEGHNSSADPRGKRWNPPDKELRSLDIQSTALLVELAEIKRDTRSMNIGVSTFCRVLT